MNNMVEYLIYKGVKKGDPISPHNLSFGVIPKINATTRSKNQDAKEIVFKGFIGNIDPKIAWKAADFCHQEQKDIIATIFTQLDKKVDNTHKVIVVFGNAEDAEYNGLAAMKLLSKYNKPILVLRELNGTTWTGSVRSPVDTLTAMNESGLCNCQGHQRAHGVTVKKCNLNKLIAWFDKQEWGTADPITEVTAQIDPKNITLPLCESIANNQTLWAMGIPEPTFYLRIIVSPMDRVAYYKKNITGKIGAGGVSFVKFQISEEEAAMLEGGNDLDVQMIVTLGVNEYNGIRTPQGIIQSWELAEIKDTFVSWGDLF